jgi:acetoin utilization deacetylase AcuC-like enzyme
VAGMLGVAEGSLRNAFCFIGAGGHHAGRNFFGGYCCFNDVAIAIAEVRLLTPLRRIAIVDTDAHHGDGTRDLVRDDPAILHVCICGGNSVTRDGTKVDVPFPTPRGCTGVDEAYLALLDHEVHPRVAGFRPELLVWYFGFDTHRGEYGDIGLTAPAFLGIAARMQALADASCAGRHLVVLGGGSRTELATALIPPVIARLVGEDASDGT